MEIACAEQMYCYRGGAFNEGVYVCEEKHKSGAKQLLRQNPFKLSIEQLQTLPDILRPVACEYFYALPTNGDGVCAMHALFGQPTKSSSGSSELWAKNARLRAIACFEPSLEVLQQRVSIAPALRSIETALWKEFVENHIKGTSTDESTIFWNTLVTQNPQLAQEAEGFFRNNATATQDYEQAKRETLVINRSLFCSDCEKTIIRPLACNLGYLPTDRDVLAVNADEKKILIDDPESPVSIGW